VRLVSRVVAGVLVVSALVTLTACENFAQGPISVKRSGQHLQIALCDGVNVTGVVGEYRDPGGGTAYSTFLDVAGGGQVPSGAIWSTNSKWSGFTIKRSVDPKMGAGVQMDVLVHTSPQSDNVWGGFTFGSNGLSSSKWLHPDGTESTLPCPVKDP
jgi:hypothetical protein